MEPEGFRRFLGKGYATGKGDAWNKIGPLKMFVDGSLGRAHRAHAQAVPR